ncbi:MAG TPA: HAMP domain-containing sensor histidine kinase [Pirellulales bacterium]
MSISIYAVVRSHLLHRLEGRCQAAIETVIASVEFDSDGLEWEPNIRHLEFEQSPSDGPLLWGVFQENGQRLDGSLNAEALDLKLASGQITEGQRTEQVASPDGIWQVIRRLVRSTDQQSTPPTEAPVGQLALADESPTEDAAAPKRYPALIIAIAIPVASALQPLNNLAIALTGISITIWLLSAFLGKWLCARALFPLTQIAHAANHISAADFSRRVPLAHTGDELDDLATALNNLLNRLQISFEQQRRFAAEASHQLRTPLTAILGQLEVALRRQRSQDEYRQALKLAHRQADLLREIVESLLFLTRESSDGTQIQFEPLELRELLSSHLEVWRQHVRFADLRLNFGDDGPLWVNAQHVLLEQALDNLIDNACKYSEPHSPICIHVARCDGEIRIEVKDVGNGISSAELPHVFDPFFRGEDSRQHGIAGFGLGLSVSQKIALFFGGRMNIESSKGRGCRVAIILPSINQSSLEPVEVES